LSYYLPSMALWSRIVGKPCTSLELVDVLNGIVFNAARKNRAPMNI